MIATRPISSFGAREIRGRTPHELAARARAVGPVLVCALLVSVLYGLPHLLMPLVLGDSRTYTPLAVTGVSALTYDETSSYAAYTNYVLRRGAPPFDTDVFENRGIPFPASIAPYFVMAGVALLAGGVEHAFVLLDFLLPPLAFVILYLLLNSLTQQRGIALLGAMTVLLVPFGPRNFFGAPISVVMGRAADVVQPLEYGRLIHPEFSFTLFAAALLLLWLTLRTGDTRFAVAGGLAGALLFYTYVYYWPVWLAASALLAVVATRPGNVGRRGLYITNIVTWLGSIPFWFMYFQASQYANLHTVVARHMSESGHIPPPHKLLYTLLYCLTFVAFVALYWRVRSTDRADLAHRRTVTMFMSAVFAASIAAFNMEIVTGFNIEAMLHYTNRLIQPFLVLSAFVFVVPLIVGGTGARGLSVVQNHGRALLVSLTLVLLGIGALRQVVVSTNVAAAHELTRDHQLLFAWLDAHTRLDDVVLATNRDINDLIPAYTPNRLFVPNGERTSAPNEEIARRFLIAMKLLGHDEEYVRSLLAQDIHHGEPPIGLTYTYFLFLGVGSWRLPDAEIDRLLADYRALDLSNELGRWRLDYVYGQGAERPIDVPGWSFDEVYANPYGRVWRVAPAPATSGG